MRPLLVLSLVIASISTGTGSEPAVRGEIENIAAFARLYGVVRYFYPSDAAATLDWGRFAVHGVKEVRNAPNADALGAVLNRLFGPLGPGIIVAASLPPADTGKPDETLIAWRYLGPGIGSAGSGAYKGKRTHRSMAATPGFASVMQIVPAAGLHGKTIRLRGHVRVSTADKTKGAAALWLRVDRPGGAMGFFYNMNDRPILEPDWREYSIEGPVADDATNVAFGAMEMGMATADFDGVRLAVADGKGGWTDVAVKDSGFEASADAPGWNRVGSPVAVISRPAGDAPEGRQFLRISSPSVATSSAELFAAVPVSGAHSDPTLGGGLFARVPLVLSDANASRVSDPKQLEALRTAIALIDLKNGPSDVDARLADVVVAWNVFRHFYPYWTEAGVDWDARLRPQLEAAHAAGSRQAHEQVLRALVADARDGHGGVNDTLPAVERAALPVRFGVADDRLVITATSAPAEAPVGAVVESIAGVPAVQRLADTMRLTSGTTQWKQARALRELTTCTRGASVELTLDDGTPSRRSLVQCTASQPPVEKRPEPTAELRPGIWYVDLTRASAAQVTAKLDTLASAHAVVFDVRGYPTDAGAAVLPYLLSAPEQDRWMHVAKIVGPFGETAGWEDYGWDVIPKSPHLSGRILFLTDGRAISYAESVMGYIKDRKLATIVGSTTAGTNGNVASFAVPGGFNITFTGMRVTGHDGRSPHHLVGVKPDIAVVPTLASIRAGRDLVLEAALGVIDGMK